MDFNNNSLTEESLFYLYSSKGYNQTRIALELALDKINSKIIKIGDTPTRKQLLETKQLIQDEISASYGGLFESMKEESLQSAMAVNAPYLLEFTSAALPTKTIDYLTSSSREILGYEFKDLFKLTEQNHIRQLKVTLASGVSQGMPAAQIIREMGIKSENLTKHQLYSAVQTTISEAREISTYATYKHLEDIGVAIGYQSVSVMDSRTSEICRNLDGKKYFMKIADVPNKPKRHFLCRSKLTPITSNEYESGKRASIDGDIPNMSYGKWFATKDDAFQLKTLGRTKYDAYKQGLYKVNDVAYLRPKNSLSLEEIGKELIREAKK